MASRLNPYLNFDGTTADAMTFYHEVFGGDLNISRFGDFGAPEGVDPDGTMHAMLGVAPDPEERLGDPAQHDDSSWRVSAWATVR